MLHLIVLSHLDYGIFTWTISSDVIWPLLTTVSSHIPNILSLLIQPNMVLVFEVPEQALHSLEKDYKYLSPYFKSFLHWDMSIILCKNALVG